MSLFDIQVEEREVTHELDERNVMVDLVHYSRSKQVLNEEQTIMVMLTYITGLLPHHSDYAAAIIKGGSSGGKTHMKQKVIDRLFALKSDWLFQTTSSSAKGLIDDPEWDASRIAALNELNKIPAEMLEFLKSVHGDDGGHDYTRNRPDPDSESGFKSVHVQSEAKPVVFMLADENAMHVEKELSTRMIEIKVDETPEKNSAVHDMHWGHSHLTLPSSTQEYIYDASDVEYSLQRHIADIPVDTPVVLPTGEGRFDGDEWDASAVTKPMFSFHRSESTRASRMIASLVKASALINHHARKKVQFDSEEHIVAAPEDVANIIFCRRTLLNITHGLGEKEFAILDAIIERGAPYGRGGTAKQMTKKQLELAMQDNKNIATIGKTELNNILEELNENYIIDITENPDDRRENLYVYDGGTALGRPNIAEAYELFTDLHDPIRDQNIEETIRQQQEAFGAVSIKDVATRDPVEQQEIDDGLTGLQEEIHGLMKENLDGAVVAVEDLDGIDYEHMVGAAPLTEQDGHVAAERPATEEDRQGTIYDRYGDGDVQNAIGELQAAGRWSMNDNDDGTVTIRVE